MRRKGFILIMWTGCICNARTGQPILFGSEVSAKRYLSRMPSWGRSAVAVRPCVVRKGTNGKRDYEVQS